MEFDTTVSTNGIFLVHLNRIFSLRTAWGSPILNFVGAAFTLLLQSGKPTSFMALQGDQKILT